MALTFLANALTLAILLLGVVALVAPPARSHLRRLVEAVGPAALPLAFAVACVATFGAVAALLALDAVWTRSGVETLGVEARGVEARGVETDAISNTTEDVRE